MKGITGAALAVKRVAQHPLHFRWTPRLLALLGRLPDAEVAARAKTTTHTVAAERKRRGIPAFMRRRPNIEWTPDRVALLGTDTDANVAARLGAHCTSVFLRRRMLGIPAFGRGGGPRKGFNWTPRALRMLGKASDRTVGRRLGISETTVCLKRQELGVPGYGPRPFFDWTAERIALLGRRRDIEVARELGINPITVMNKRHELGITRYRKSGRAGSAG